MTTISLITNVSSSQTQRRLASSSSQLEQSFQRLSSGLRINRATDDAAGLAVAAGLNIDSRVLAQGIRNLNDAASSLNVAEGALDELSSIVIRQRELAVQAANGVLSAVQRRALAQEANALGNEFNRIVESTRFNGSALLESSQEVTYQAGYGNSGGVHLSLGDQFDRTVGTGLFETAQGSLTSPATSSGLNIEPFAVGDLNGDLKLDIAVATGSDVRLLSGNGDGSFSEVVLSAGNYRAVAAGDFNNDGRTDLAAYQYGPDIFEIFLNNGTGLALAQSYAAWSPEVNEIAVGDFNGDGISDFAARADTAVHFIFRNGDGSFMGSRSFTASGPAYDFFVADYDLNGTADLFISTSAGVDVVTNTGGGGLTMTALGGAATYAVAAVDLNNDGFVDLAAMGQAAGEINISLGSGGLSYSAPVTIQGVDGHSMAGFRIGDFNNDGNSDFGVVKNTGFFMTIIGNGDGSFKAPQTGAGEFLYGGTVGDFNGDGALDVFTTGWTDNCVALNKTGLVSTMPRLDLYSQAAARNALRTIDETLRRVTAERGAIGSSQSRLASAISNLSQSRENYEAAASRIRDVDTASETSVMLRGRILQQAGAAVLAQANRVPALALDLLRG